MKLTGTCPFLVCTDSIHLMSESVNIVKTNTEAVSFSFSFKNSGRAPRIFKGGGGLTLGLQMMYVY